MDSDAEIENHERQLDCFLDKVYLQASLVWKGLTESIKLPNNNYGVLLMKHFQVYWQSETIWWRYISEECMA
jgi:hypothetical protein